MATALELRRDEWKRYIKSARERSVKRELTSDEKKERERTLRRIRKAAEVLKTRFHAQRVILFGSFAHEAWFMPDSDVDIAVEGLGQTDYFRAWRVAEEVIAERPVDLIEMETASHSLLEAIKRHGVEL